MFGKVESVWVVANDQMKKLVRKDTGRLVHLSGDGSGRTATPRLLADGGDRVVAFQHHPDGKNPDPEYVCWHRNGEQRRITVDGILPFL